MSNNYHNVSKLDTTKILQCGKKHVMSIALLSMTTIPCQGMELAWTLFSSAAPVVGMMVPESVKNTMSGYANTLYGESKDFENLFKDFTANRCETKLKDLVGTDIKKIEEKASDILDYKNASISFNFNRPETCELAEISRKYLLKYSLAVLTLEYIDQCKELIAENIKKIGNIKNKYGECDILIETTEKIKKDELKNIEIILEYLGGIKNNLGAALYAKYKYTRKGGPVDRYRNHATFQNDRYKYWGFYDWPALNNSSRSCEVNSILNSNSQFSEYAKYTSLAYDKTMELLKETEEKLISCSDPYAALEDYRQQYRDLFKQEPSEIKITSKLVESYNPIRDQLLGEKSTSTFPQNSTTQAISIPRRNSGEKSSSQSQSYSLGDVSSVPTNFGDAINRYNSTSTSANPSSDYDISSIAHNKQLSLPKSPSIPKEVKVLEPIPQPEIKKANLYNNIIDDYSFNKEKEIEYSEEEDMGEHYNYSDESKSAG